MNLAQSVQLSPAASVKEFQETQNLSPSNNSPLPLKNEEDKSPSSAPSLIDAPKVQPRLTFEEIRAKRLQLLMPETWPNCNSWELPPEPQTEVDPELQSKVAGLHAILERGIQFNERLQANQSFRNPHIYDKLVEFLGLDEFGTNFTKSWYDPLAFPSSIKGSRLTEAQKAAAKAKAVAQAANPRSNISFVPAQAPSEIASSAIKRVLSSVDKSAANTHYPGRFLFCLN